MSNTYYLIGLILLLTQLRLVQATTDCSTVTQIPLAECEALIDFYNNTNGPNWIDNAGWNVTNTPCQWKGVTCSNKQVTSIYLWNNNLSGLIPESIGNFSQLRTLYLQKNHLSSPLPDSLGNLSQLRGLLLGKNQLNGSLPDSLKNLSNLQDLSLGNNQLSGPIPDWLGNLSNLRSITLYENQLSGTIPDSLKNLNQLQYLLLGANLLSGSIPSWLGNLTSLINLLLFRNQLSGTIPDSLGKLNQLQYLLLGGNSLSGSIPESIGNLSNLQILSLENNKLSSLIPNALSNLGKLQGLYLYGNQLSGSIPESIGKLGNLQILYLVGNQLSGSIPKSIEKLSNLELLLLSNNQLSGSIPESINNLIKLRWLWLANNQLCGNIPFSLMNLQLEWLELDHNHLTTSNPDLINWLNQKNPTWANTQTPCPRPQSQRCCFVAPTAAGVYSCQFTLNVDDCKGIPGSVAYVNSNSFCDPNGFTCCIQNGNIGFIFKDKGVVKDLNETCDTQGKYIQLPVSIVNFTSTLENNGHISLEGTVTNLGEQAYLNIWRAQIGDSNPDGGKEITSLKKINATEFNVAPFEQASFSTEDTNPLSGVNYYVLEEVNLNGKSSAHCSHIQNIALGGTPEPNLAESLCLQYTLVQVFTEF